MKNKLFLLAIFTFALCHAAEVNFSRDIKPLLSDRCFHCHGPDEETREGHIRFDVPDGEDGAFRVRKKRAAIVPGKPDESHLYLRIITEDEDDVMPPTDSHKVPLTAKEKETFKKWIEQGAKWEGHWAFQKPTKPAVPKATKWAKNPIDNFILSKLNKQGLQPSAEGPRYKLIRRLSYDLTGLPPTPAEVDAFTKDKSPNAYEKLVDRLLAKPSYGERMALPWLDMARYGDSSVYHADGPRTMWPWRDWVIKAYNDNKPFDQFTIEQIAGDHIPNKTIDQHIATAFLRNNGTTDEGGAFFEEYRVEYTVDRLSTVSSIWLGLTTACAQCHDHKYDPLTQEEFFKLYAFFNIAADPGRQTRHGNEKPVANVPLPQERLMLVNILNKEISDLEAKKVKNIADKQGVFKKWLADQHKGVDFSADLTALAHYFPFSSQQLLDDIIDHQNKKKLKSAVNHYQEVNGTDEKKDDKGKIVAQTKAIKITRHPIEYAQKGDWIESDQAFTVASWLKRNKHDNMQAIISKIDSKQKDKGYEVLLNKEGKLLLTLIRDKDKSALKVESETALALNKWQNFSISYDGSSKAAGVKMYIDGQPVKTKTLTDTLNGSLKNKANFTIGKRGGFHLKGPITQLQIYNKVLSAEAIAATRKLSNKQFLYTETNRQRKELIANLQDHYFKKIDQDDKKFTKQIGDKKQRLNKAEQLNVMVMEDQKNPRKTYILNRGAYDQPKTDKEILPDTPSVLPPMKKDYPKNRLGLAKWIMDEDNPLTARVTVNRYWMMFFGHGLVDTVDDFGNQGSWPTHPELLDWLAVDFRESGWNVKRALKQIVMSSTYRQDSVLNKKLLATDQANHLYARGPRFRLVGEHIRDTALFVSGLLNPKIGGESVKPYQPAGLWHEVALTNARFVQDKGDKNYRKSMYTFYKRSAPIPNMVTFDAPSREKCTIKRSRTNTPLQALVTLNDPIFVEAARFFAERIIREGGASVQEKIDYAFMNATARKPNSAIRDLVIKLYERRLADFTKDPAKSKAFLAIGDKKRDESLNPAEHAAWTVIAQLALNLDETLNKE